jgi:DNA-binding transcriptional LysR family regulator
MALVPGAMARLAADHPGLAVALHESSTPALLRRLRSRRLGVAVIGVGQGLPEYDLDGLMSTTVLRGDLLVAVSISHRFADRKGVAVDDLSNERWIAGEGDAGDPQFGAWPTLSDPLVVQTARSWASRLGLVAAGLGITTIPELARQALPAGVRAVTVTDRTWHGRATLAVTRPDPSATTQAMVDALRAQAAHLAGAA